MPGILDESYGAAQERRGKRIKYTVLIALAVAVVGLVAYFSLRTWSQQHAVARFLDDLKQQKYHEAYELWGCPEDATCKYYPAEKFLEDWGPSGLYSRPAELKIDHVDVCDGGVVFDMSYPRQDNFGLWLSRSNNHFSFAPQPRCGRHLELDGLFHRLFS